MLKKIIVGIFCFIVLAVTGAGIYLYTLDWNKHKAVVAQRISQITGLKASIDGNLDVKLFPSPKFTAGKVRFLKNTGGRDPLVVVNEIGADVELMPLLDNNFIIRSMNLKQATVYVTIDEKGNLNWNGVGKNTHNKSGNIEVSFNDVRLNNATLSYQNKAANKEFNIAGISANVSASALNGPYKVSGKFIHNSSEVQFKGDIVNDKSLILKMSASSASSGTAITLDGTLGSGARGNLTFDTQSLTGVANLIFGKDSMPEHYSQPLYFSFKYGYDDGIIKFDNFTAKYDKNTAGSGTVIAKKNNGRIAINADFDMTRFDLNLLTGIGQDILTYVQGGKKIAESPFAKYDMNISVKSGTALYNNVEAQNLSFGITLLNNVIDITRFGLVMPGSTNIKTVGRINLNNGIEYIFNQIYDTQDLRTFASIFNIDLAKFASKEDKKSIFKKAQAEVLLSGNLESLKISVPKALVDSTSLQGNVGFVKKEKDTYVIVDANLSKVIFDKYLQAMPDNLKNGTLQDKFVYQMNLIPWNRALNVEGNINIGSAVYNDIPMENIALDFATNQEDMTIKKLSFGNIGGATLDLSMDADHVFSQPHFNELSYNITSANFPAFAATMNIDTGDAGLFKRRIFAAQGALSGTFSEFSLSSIQKFGDTEFSYTGTVANDAKTGTSVNGDLELKSNNFTSFVKALNFNYTPDIPVTTFTLSAKIKGALNLFALDDVSAYLGANAISGNLQFDNTAKTPKLAAVLNFDRFEADRWFNLSASGKLPSIKNNAQQAAFIKQPDWSKKFDFAPLGKIDLDVKGETKLLNLFNKPYTNVKSAIQLKDGVLNVASFDATQDKGKINLRFILNSNSMPKIDGYFKVDELKTPKFGGTVYAMESGWLNAEGTFNSAAGSWQDFFDNLNAKGKFSLSNTAVYGWDLDIIKFELEQRKSVSGFEDTVLNSLKSGKSSFSRIRGAYNVNKGLVVADSVIWESPVVNMNMKFNFNFSDWLFSAVFNAVYHNASFSDVLKFTFDGNLANPTVKTDLSESIKRISEIEDRIKNARYYQEKEKMARVGDKIKVLQKTIDNTLQDISRITLDVVRFKPKTNNENVNDVYDENTRLIASVEIAVKKMQDSLNNYPEEEELMNIEADLGAEQAKLKYIPKVLEENFLVDSKYIFDDTFNKIAWVYNLAQNNSAYHKGLTDVYMSQIELLDATDTPVNTDDANKLQDGRDKVKEVMENISTLHGKIRDSYLNVIDTNKTSDMRENNEVAEQALKTMLAYTKQLNEDIILNLDKFREVLNISARDYDDYLVYPPESIEEIDVKQPTVKNGAAGNKTSTPAEKTKDNDKTKNTDSAEDKAPTAAETNNVPANGANESATSDKAEVAANKTAAINELKKKESVDLALNSSDSGLSDLLKKQKAKQRAAKELALAENIQAEGLQQLLKSNVTPEVAETVIAETGLNEPVSSVDIAVAEDVAVDKNEPIAPVQTALLTPSQQATPLPQASALSQSLTLPEEKNISTEIKTPVDSQEKPVVAETPKPVAKDIYVTEKKSAPSAENGDVPFFTIKDEPEANILAQTRAAIDKIMKKLNATEKKTKPKSVEIADVALPEMNTADKAAPVAENTTSNKPRQTMRINPVVALNIGKSTTQPATDNKLKFASNRKKFAAADTSAKSATNKPLADVSVQPEPIVTAKAESLTVSAPVLLPEQASAVQPGESALPTGAPHNSVLLEMIAVSDRFSGADAADITKEALVSIEMPKVEKSEKNLYIFPKGAPYAESGGTIGKSMLGERPSEAVKTAHNKYVFAVGRNYSRSFSGEVAKRASLSEI